MAEFTAMRSILKALPTELGTVSTATIAIRSVLVVVLVHIVHIAYVCVFVCMFT